VPRDAQLFEPGDDFLALVIPTDTTLARPLAPIIIQTRRNFKGFEETAHIYVEVIEYRASHKLFTFPIHFSEHAVIDAWDEASDLVESEISIKEENVLCTEFLHRGLEKGRCLPMVVITSPTTSSDIWWNDIPSALRFRLRSVTPLFKVELLCAKTL
jgi:hypothetical protein